jgi:REP-associated tyrosine transposase
VARKPRTDLADALHHVSARANGDELLFRESEDRREFLQNLRNVCRRHEWRFQAYCLMGTHFHLIVHTAKPTLSAGMARLCTSYAQWFNWRYDRHWHLFGGRFSSQHITNETHLFEAHRYVALNPVRAQHCDDPADWRWGSYRALAGLERPVDFLDVDAVYALFEPQLDAPATYREFVLSGLERLGSNPSGVRPLRACGRR